MNEKQESYILGRLHENILQIRNDLHMGDAKAALSKANDAIKLIEELPLLPVNEINSTDKNNIEL